jgi:hypothetical protein
MGFNMGRRQLILTKFRLGWLKYLSRFPYCQKNLSVITLKRLCLWISPLPSSLAPIPTLLLQITNELQMLMMDAPHLSWQCGSNWYKESLLLTNHSLASTFSWFSNSGSLFLFLVSKCWCAQGHSFQWLIFVSVSRSYLSHWHPPLFSPSWCII